MTLSDTCREQIARLVLWGTENHESGCPRSISFRPGNIKLYPNNAMPPLQADGERVYSFEYAHYIVPSRFEIEDWIADAAVLADNLAPFRQWSTPVCKRCLRSSPLASTGPSLPFAGRLACSSTGTGLASSTWCKYLPRQSATFW